MSDVLEDTTVLDELVPFEDDGDTSTLAHIFVPPDNLHAWVEGMSSKEMVDAARLTQTELLAICGAKLTPRKNPDSHDICQACVDTAGAWMRRAGE